MCRPPPQSGTAGKRAATIMKVLDRKLLRELLASKGLILAITSLMAVGVMAFVYMRSAYANLNRAKDDYYRQCRMADFWIDVKKAPLSELEALAELPGVSEVRPRIQFYATVDLERNHRRISSQRDANCCARSRGLVKAAGVKRGRRSSHPRWARIRRRAVRAGSCGSSGSSTEVRSPPPTSAASSSGARRVRRRRRRRNRRPNA